MFFIIAFCFCHSLGVYKQYKYDNGSMIEMVCLIQLDVKIHVLKDGSNVIGPY